MPVKIKIGIVEDDELNAKGLRICLLSLGFEDIFLCKNYDEAILMLKEKRPELVLLDIQLNNSKDGIEIAKYIRKNHDIPFIFLSATNDPAILDRSRVVKPEAFLSKPFQKIDLFMAIELALDNFTSGKKLLPKDQKHDKNNQSVIFIKDGYNFQKVNLDEIQFLCSDHVYINIHTANKKFLVRACLEEYLEKFDPNKFIRVHQRYAVNVNYIDKITQKNLIINQIEIPISKSYQTSLMEKLIIG